jgi:hypothetical protein
LQEVSEQNLMICSSDKKRATKRMHKTEFSTPLSQNSIRKSSLLSRSGDLSSQKYFDKQRFVWWRFKYI